MMKLKKFPGTKSINNPTDSGETQQKNKKGPGKKLEGKKDFTKNLGKVKNGTEFKPNLKNKKKQNNNLKNGKAANPKEFLENVQELVQVRKEPFKKKNPQNKGGQQMNKNVANGKKNNFENKQQLPGKPHEKKNQPQSPEKSPNLEKKSQNKPQNAKKNNLGLAPQNKPANQNAKQKNKSPKSTENAPAMQKATTKNKKPKKSAPQPSLQEAPEFDEKKFNEVVTQENAEKIVVTLNKQVSEEISKMKNQVFADYKYLINVTCFKIPNCPKRIVRLNLKNSFVPKDGDVCIIVRDLQRGLRVDYEPTIQHFEDLFKKKGVKGIKTIIPFNQLKTEYKSYEMKIKLSNMYDCYLVDSAISKHVGGFLGKKFQRTKCTLYPVRLDEEDLVKQIKTASSKTSYRQLEKGPLISIPVGIDSQTPKQVAQNIIEVVKQLKDVYPGSLANIRNIYLRINVKGTSSLPLYINMGKPLESTPYVIGPKEKKLNNLKAEASKVLKKFTVSRTGALIPISQDVSAQKRPMNEEESQEKSPVKAKKQKLQAKQTGKQQESNESKVAKNKSKKDKRKGSDKSASDLDAESENDAELVEEDSSEEEDDDETVEENNANVEGKEEDGESAEDEDEDEIEDEDDDDDEEDDDGDDDNDDDDDDDNDDDDDGDDDDDDDDDGEESSD